MRDERTLKDVCVEAIVTLVLIRILYPDQVGCRRLGSLLQLHRSRYGLAEDGWGHLFQSRSQRLRPFWTSYQPYSWGIELQIMLSA